jgi:hypothetical protein
MATVRRTRASNRAGVRRLRRDIGHALTACVTVLALVGLFGLVRNNIQPTIRNNAALEGQDDDLRTGSILFVPIYGNRCRQKLIDNATWRIWDVGPIDCDEAMARSAARTHAWSAARVDVVRDGFRKK